MKTYNYEIKPIITGSMEGDSKEQVIEKIKEQFEEYPHEINEVIDSEITLTER